MTGLMRSLFRRPGFLVAAVLTLALGFGVNSLMFSVVNAVFWAELPYGEAERLVHLAGTDPDGRFHVSEREYRRYGKDVGAFASVGAYYADGSVNVGTEGVTRKEPAAFVTATLMPTLGTGPALGRNFTDEEDAEGGPRAALLQHAFWQSAFGGDPGIVGRAVTVDGRAVTVVGVMPPGFRLPTQYGGPGARLFLPLRIGEPDPRNLHFLDAIARVQDGVSLAAARQELAGFARRLESDISTLPRGFRIAMTPMREVVAGDVRSTLYLLYAMVVLLLVVACANVTALSLARARARVRDLSIQKALGASFARLAGLVVTELLLVFCIGGALGLALAAAGLQFIHLLPTAGLPLVRQPGIDEATMAYMFLTIVLSGLASAAMPVMRLKRVDAAALMSEGGRHATGGNSHGSRRVLVAGQMALTFVLAVTALLTLKSLARVNATDPGYESAGLLTMQLSLPSQSYPDKHEVRGFYDELLKEIRALPGVLSAGATTHLPIADDPGDWGLRLEGRESEKLPSGRSPWADWIVVSEGYHEAMQVSLMAGRTFNPHDTDGTEPVVVVNEAMANAYWPGGDALGQRLRMSTDIDGVYRRIVGIVADTRHAGPDAAPRPQMYLPASQFPAGSGSARRSMSLVVRADAPLPALRDQVLSLVTDMDPAVAASRVRTMDAWLSEASSLRRLSFQLSGIFAALALALLAVGVYGLISLLTAERTREISVRKALGADQRRIQSVLMKPTLALTLAGIGAGFATVSIAGNWLSGLLYRVSPLDPAVLAVAGGGILLLVCAATWVPARRAARIAPMEALRHE